MSPHHESNKEKRAVPRPLTAARYEMAAFLTSVPIKGYSDVSRAHKNEFRCNAVMASEKSITRRSALLLGGLNVGLLWNKKRAHGASESGYLYSGKNEEFLKDGIRILDISKGNGSEAREGSSVSIHYTSRLAGLNGILLDSTRDGVGNGVPLSYKIGDANSVVGFDTAIRGMKTGGIRRVFIPEKLAYKSPNDIPSVKEFFAKRRLLSVLNTNRDASIVFE